MVIFGGVTSPSVDIFTNPAATNDVQVFDIVSLNWYKPSITAAAGSTIPLPQKFVPCVGFSTGEMFVLMANTNYNAANNIAVLDLMQQTWQEITTVFPPLDFPIGVTLTDVNDILYRYAGLAVNLQGNQAQAIEGLLYSLDSKTLVWTSRANGPPLAYHTACYLSKFDVIAVFGGQGIDFQPQDVLSTYSVSQGIWNQVDQPVSNKPSARFGHTAVCKADQMIIFGGGSVSSNGIVLSDDSLWLLIATSATSFTWSQPVTYGTKGPAARLGHSAVLFENRMLVFGGIGGDNDTSVYELDTITWTWYLLATNVTNPSTPTSIAPSSSSSNTAITAGSIPVSAASQGSKTIASALFGTAGLLFIAVVLFTACHYRRKNRKLRSDNDEMSKIDSALDGNSNDTSLPPRSREVILTLPITALSE
ncbi:5629_t:CDS:2 [Paraglomus occultum]|uniref:5629_t:CDS:1 n=1 Tax=Paraglomus occultum TaxID=144539 RepID=A0A9N8YSH7_9GLOM|nr:5629_t:CDS:2 [Paraglomus occultum]